MHITHTQGRQLVEREGVHGGGAAIAALQHACDHQWEAGKADSTECSGCACIVALPCPVCWVAPSNSTMHVSVKVLTRRRMVLLAVAVCKQRIDKLTMVAHDFVDPCMDTSTAA